MVAMLERVSWTKLVDQSQTPPLMHRLVFVTGPSGAGRSTAIRAFEDLDYEVIDNLPLRLVTGLVAGAPSGRPIALGLDVRNRDFNATALIELIDTLTRDARVALEVLYLDCAPSELVRRYSETRRRHPLAPHETPSEGIARENDLLMPIRVRADHLIDTTELSVHDLKGDIGRWFGREGAAALAVSLQSFSYRRGLPRGVDMIFDCRFLSNPHWVPALRGLDGRDRAVVDHIRSDARFAPFYDKVRDLVLLLLPAHLDEGKAHLTIGFGCTGGQHRSVAMVELLGQGLAEAGWTVSKRHRELERKGPQAAPETVGAMQP
jgi:RNase adapter protein RapZ